MIATASTLKVTFCPKKLIAQMRASILTLTLASLIALPAQTAQAQSSSCMPQKGLFGNYQSDRNKKTPTDIPFLQASGEETTLADYAGKGLIVNFWATWCAPCVREMPQLNRLSAFVRNNNIEVLTISEDLKGLTSAPKFYKTHNLNDLPVLVDKKGKLMRAFAAPGLPLTVLINQHGQEVGRVVGLAEWDSVEIVDFVRNCLSKKDS
ncbi:MAG: TlpA disulfide reductase family protein [Rhodospirillales bacterium]|jgi:thiol-disulfide isomerase/thioredoxin|tara:strand:+ start:907 stop:1530 length:624 start_codon:yes stop_codon:yes gene_type:complete